MSPTAFDAGDIEARLTLDRDPFTRALEEAKGDARDFEDGDYRARLGADDADLTAKVDEADARLDELDGKTAEPRIDAETEDFDLKADDVQARIDRLKSDVATARVDIDDRAALRKLAEMQLALDAYGNETLNPRLSSSRLGEISSSVDELGSKLKEVSSDADSAASSTDRLAKSQDNAKQSAGGLTAALLPLAPALVDVAAVGGAGILSFADMVTTASLGLGAFALAAQGDLKTVEASAKSMLTSFQQSQAATVLPAIQGALPVMAEGFRLLPPLVTGASDAIQVFEQNAGAALAAPYWRQFFDFLGGQANSSLTTFGTLIGGTATALSGLDRVFQPVIADVEHGLTDLGTSLDHFGMGASGSGGLQSFVSFLVSEAPLVGSTLSSLVTDIRYLAPAFAQAGVPMLQVTRALAEIVGYVAEADPWLVELGVLGYGVSKAWGPVSSVFKGVTSAMDSLTSDGGGLAKLSAGWDSFVGVFTRTSSEAGPAADAVRGFGDAAAVTGGEAAGAAGTIGAVGEAAALSGDEAEAATVGVDAFGISLNAALGIIGLVAIGIGALITVLEHESAATKEAASRWTQDYVAALNSSGDTIAQQEAAIRRQIAALNAQNDAMRRTATVNEGSQRFMRMTTQTYYTNAAAAKSNADRIKDLRGALQNLITQQQASAAAQNRLASGTDNAAAKLRDLDTVANQSATAVGQLTTALDQLDGRFLSAQQATVAQYQALQSLKPQIDAAGGSLSDLNSKTQAAYAGALSFASGLYGTVVPAYVKAGYSTSLMTSKIEEQIRIFNHQLLAAGDTAAEVQHYDGMLHLLPAEVRTAITLAGAKEAQQAAAALQQQLDATARVYTATINIVTNEAGGAAAHAYTVYAGQHYATGVNSHPGGMAVVGEAGPELVELPRGTTVYPSHISKAMVAKAPSYAEGTADTHRLTSPGFHVTDVFNLDAPRPSVTIHLEPHIAIDATGATPATVPVVRTMITDALNQWTTELAAIFNQDRR